LPAITSSAKFTVSWSGSDGANGSGIASYTVYVSDNGSTFTPPQTSTTATSAPFTGKNGHTYAFYCVASDKAGNRQPAASTAQATTTIKLPHPAARTAREKLADTVFSPSPRVSEMAADEEMLAALLEHRNR
jgi:hypothetical protein